MKRSPTVTALRRIQECLGKINQRGIPGKVRKKGEQLFLCRTNRPKLIHILIRLHEDSPQRFLSYGVNKNVWKISQGHNWETRKGETMILVRDTSS